MSLCYIYNPESFILSCEKKRVWYNWKPARTCQLRAQRLHSALGRINTTIIHAFPNRTKKEVPFVVCHKLCSGNKHAKEWALLIYIYI